MGGLTGGGGGLVRRGAYMWQFTASYKTTSDKFCHLFGK